jgi:adenosine deaminase
MAGVMEKIEADIEIYWKARKKFDKCSYAENSPHYLGYCKLFHFTFDNGVNFLNHCGCCRANTSEPTIAFPARKS